MTEIVLLFAEITTEAGYGESAQLFQTGRRTYQYAHAKGSPTGCLEKIPMTSAGCTSCSGQVPRWGGDPSNRGPRHLYNLRRNGPICPYPSFSAPTHSVRPTTHPVLPPPPTRR